MMYDKILIGFDESEYSMAAVKEVAAWIKKHGGEARLVHGVYFDEEEFGIKPNLLKERIDKGESACYRAQTIAAEFGIPMESVVKEGEPPEVIVNTAIQDKADLIALGTHGRKGISRMLIGSVTAKVVAEAPCDVLIVRRSCEKCSGKYENILVAFDGSESSSKALKKACELAKTDTAKVTAIYVIPQYQEMINFFKTEGINKVIKEEANKILDQARAIGNEAGIEVATSLEEGSPSERLVQYVKDNKIDLVVMGSYGWNGINKSIIGSTAERVIMLTEGPVLVAR